MPFRARLLPRSLARRRPASTASPHGPVGQLRAIVGPGARHLSDTSVLVRRFTTTPASSSAASDFFTFPFSRRASKDAGVIVTANNARERYLQSVESGDPEGLVAAYDILASAHVISDPSTSAHPAEISSQDLVDGMNVLASASDVCPYIKPLRQMYYDTTRTWGYPRHIGHRSALALGLCRAGNGGQALRTLRGVERDQVDWSAFLALIVKYDPSQTAAAWDLLRSAGTPTVGDYALRLVELRNRIDFHPGRRGDVGAELDSILKDLQRDGWHLDGDMDADTVRIWTDAGRHRDAAGVVASWEQRNHNRQQWSLAARIAEIGLLVHTDIQRAIQRCNDMNEQGRQLPGWIPAEIAWIRFTKLKQPLIDAVESAERETLTPMESEGWTRFFLRLRHRSDLGRGEAAEAYRIARSRGTGITAVLADLITGLYETPGMEEGIDRAMEIYDNAIRSDIDPRSWANRDALRAMTRRLLLWSASGHVRPDIAVRLLEEANVRDISIPENSRNLSAMARLVKRSPNHHVGYSIYSLYRSQNDTSPAMYNAIVNAFINLSPPSEPDAFLLPPVDLLMRLIRDGTSSGLAMRKHPITSLVSRYGQLVTQTHSADERFMIKTKIYKAVQDLHLQFKMDPNIEIDTELLCAFMDAYNRLEDFKTATNIWGDIVSRRKTVSPEEIANTYPAAVQIALDFTSFSGQAARCRRVWQWAKKHGFVSSVKTWNGRIESLCRLGYFEEATDLVCSTMKNGEEGAPKPDAETIRVLLKYSWRVPQQRPAILERLEHEFPDLWDAVKVHVGQVHRPGYDYRRSESWDR